ncbi:MAG: DUF1836 domain-containing protein [Lachnospiraceae bacterium]|jgi:hypothetical protein|nr:DUF1836 domain-containing protein [Lachnospiraceae bacterium]MBR5357006.1 DUF1836 domain-containing protein [Lachnospiraceae bacterium]
MTIDTKDLLNSMIASFERMSYIKPEEIPDIDLYMDQVTTFMDDRLRASTRNKNDDKLMTKTMINNYAKNDVIPPPIRKKYNKEHLLLLIMIYYFKSILQINDIKDLLDPIVEKYFNSESEFGIEDIYRTIFDDKEEQLAGICEDVVKQYKEALTKFSDAPESDKDYLQIYSFVCTLGCDVFVKKLVIEKIVDSLREHRKEETAKEKSGEGSSKDNKYDVTVDKKDKGKK